MDDFEVIKRLTMSHSYEPAHMKLVSLGIGGMCSIFW